MFVKYNMQRRIFCQSVRVARRRYRFVSDGECKPTTGSALPELLPFRVEESIQAWRRGSHSQGSNGRAILKVRSIRFQAFSRDVPHSDGRNYRACEGKEIWQVTSAVRSIENTVSHLTFVFHRYRIIVIVSVCEKFMQDVNYSSKHLWDPARDSNVTYIYDSPYFSAIGICYAIYFEWNSTDLHSWKNKLLDNQ